MGKKNEWERQALSYFSASTWQNWMKRRPRSPGGRLTSHPTPHPHPTPCCRGGVWVWSTVALIGHIILFFSDSILKPLTPPRPQNTLTHPPPAPPSLSHGALVSTDQAFNSSIKTYAYRDWTRTWRGEGKKTTKTKKKKESNQLIMNFAKDVFKSLVPKLPHWQLCAWWDTVWIEPASIFKSGGERRLARRCHGNQADLDLSVLMFRYVLCWLFYFHVWSRAGNFLFLFLSFLN